MSSETRLDRVDTIGRLLLIVRDALEPTIWRHHHCDQFTYFRVQEQRTDSLSAADLDTSPVHGRKRRIERRMLSDPQKLLRLLKLSPRLRAKIFGVDDHAYEHVMVLYAVRGKWAHGQSISHRDVDRALASATHLARTAGATRAVDRIDALHPRGRSERPKDAA